MNKKGGRDARQDPDPDEEVSAANYRVDRVYAPARTREPSPSGAPATRRALTPAGADAEIALRRQLSQAQRALADAQRAIADKDEEVAVEVEKRLALAAAYEALGEAHAAQQQQLAELSAYQARSLGVEQRLLDTVTTAEEHSRARDREREARLVAESRVEELTASLEEAYRSWKAERAALEYQHEEEVTKLETQKRMAGDAAGAALMATTSRMRESHEDELAQLRDSHERSLAMLRGELEPKALEALSLAEARQALEDELAALRTETSRAAAEREEAAQREHAQLVESHVLELAQQQRQAAAELARVTAERDALTQSLQQATRQADARSEHLEQALAEAVEARTRLDRELADARLTVERLLAEAAVATDRHVAATSQIEQLVEQKRSLRERLELAEGEARRNALDRRHFAAYLEEGLAMLRDPEEPDMLITASDPDDPAADLAPVPRDEPAGAPAGTTS